jgi:hypothetical protein
MPSDVDAAQEDYRDRHHTSQYRRVVLLDDIMPVWDATRIEHRVIPGSRTAVYDTALAVDLLDVGRHNAAVRALFAARAGAERVVQAARGAPEAPDPEPPPSLRLGDLADEGEWLQLGAQPSEEFVFGALGRFWAGRTEWQVVTASQFVEFASPGFAKIAANLSFREYGAAQTLVSYEARTAATDAVSRAQFLRYWRVVGPFVGVVMRGTLSLAADTVAGRGA